MKSVPRILVFLSLCLGLTMSVSGCKEEKLTLAGESLTFVEGQEATKSLAVKSGTAESVSPAAAVAGLSASVDGAAIKVKASSEVKVGSYKFTVLGKGKTEAAFTVTVAKAGAVEPKTTEPGAVEPKTTEPGAVEPKTTEPGAGQPKTTEPGPGPGENKTADNGQPPKTGAEPSKTGVEENLVLDPTTVILEPNHSSPLVKVVKGAVKIENPNATSSVKTVAAENKVPYFWFENDAAHKGLRVNRVEPAVQGAYKATIKAASGPGVELTVLVPPMPTNPAIDLKMEKNEVELPAGKQDTKVVAVKAGWASHARVNDAIVPDPKAPNDRKKWKIVSAKGLKATVDSTPHVEITNGGFNYKADEELTVAGTIKLKITKVDDKGAVTEVAVTGTPAYTPNEQRTVNLPAKGGSGFGAWFDVTNSVKIETSAEVGAGRFEVYITGPGGKACSFWVKVAAK